MQENEHSLSKSIYNATKWSAITNIMRKLVSPITNMVLARLLAPDAFGVVATINMVISFADIFSDAGFQKYLVQHEFDTETDLYKSANVAFWTNFSLSIFLWGIILAFRSPIATLVGSEGYGFHLAVAGLTIPLLSFSSIQQALFRRNFDFKGMFVPRMINSLIPVIVTIPLAYITRNCWALIIGSLASNFSDAVLLTIKSKWKPQLYYNFDKLKKMFSFSAWTLLESLSIWLTINIDIFILGRMISSHYLGLYKTSITSVNQITTLITTTIIPVLFSTLSRCQKDNELFQNTLYKFQKKSAIILIPMSIGMLMYSDVVTWILLGSQWRKATIFIGPLGLMQAFTVLYANFASEVYRAKGEPKVSFVVQIIYIVCIIPGVSYGAKVGFEQLCYIRAALMVLFILIHLIVLDKRYGFSVKKLIAGIIQPLYASFIMAVVGMLMYSRISNMPLKAASIIICMVVYFVSCLFFKDTRNIVVDFAKKISAKG